MGLREMQDDPADRADDVDADRDQRLPEPGLLRERVTVRALLDLIAALEDNDDVQNVYANFEVSDDALAKFAA